MSYDNHFRMEWTDLRRQKLLPQTHLVHDVADDRYKQLAFCKRKKLRIVFPWLRHGGFRRRTRDWTEADEDLGEPATLLRLRRSQVQVGLATRRFLLVLAMGATGIHRAKER